VNEAGIVAVVIVFSAVVIVTVALVAWKAPVGLARPKVPLRRRPGYCDRCDGPLCVCAAASHSADISLSESRRHLRETPDARKWRELREQEDGNR
jgi:hypothetical protein